MKTNLLQSLLPGILALTLASPLPAAVIYRQTFGNGDIATASLYDSQIDWKSLYATNLSPNVADGSALNTFYAGISPRQGNPDNLPSVNAPASASEANGFVALRNGSSTFYTVLAYADHYTIDQSAYRIDSVQWTAGASVNSSIRAAIQIDDQWYVSSSITPVVIADNSSLFATQAQQYTIHFDTTSWYTLSADSGAPFAIGETPVSALPDGIITAFGAYMIPRAAASSFLWMDSYTINAQAIPEPATMALTLSALGGLLLIHRRKK